MNTSPQVDGLLGRLSGPIPSNDGTSVPSWRSGAAAEYIIGDSSTRVPRPLHRRLSPDQRTALIASFTAGVKQKDLAIQYGVSIRSVKRLVRSAREQSRQGHA
ncbi:sigma-70 family RNA polymerase sigma factor [Glycomyces tenuis]|uniref:sigma-70 family RNA polymerase sigma factor n=1 Tax=Glycomyces tenuis TaxID=58116 RepID=UPI00138AE667